MLSQLSYPPVKDGYFYPKHAEDVKRNVGGTLSAFRINCEIRAVVVDKADDHPNI